ncbi:hypothetical protein NDU88_005341 [Pleurodeles waltl]|uniref:Uncharacterized protein n=1 Tax=Pleurodeles waltl TaxID=8319 RepID=A0AAV7RJC6_PLEWA|nr:hypothetical protein NDU88_005341 [Pleurodeles waltl]
MAVPSGAVLETAVPSGAGLEMAVPSGAVLETAVPSGAVLEKKGPAERCLRWRCPAERCLRRRAASTKKMAPDKEVLVKEAASGEEKKQAARATTGIKSLSFFTEEVPRGKLIVPLLKLKAFRPISSADSFAH